MPMLTETVQTADWKSEKHVPVIECDENIQADQMFDITVTLGKEVAHPNKTEHHIRWINLFFQPESSKVPYQIAKVDFCAHGASTQGPDSSGVYTHHTATAMMKAKESGTLQAFSYCNIHGLWQSTKKIKVS